MGGGWVRTGNHGHCSPVSPLPGPLPLTPSPLHKRPLIGPQPPSAGPSTACTSLGPHSLQGLEGDPLCPPCSSEDPALTPAGHGVAPRGTELDE